LSESIVFPQPSGPIYIIPDVNETGWGQNVTDFLVALPNGIPPTSGTFDLTGDLSFGAFFGLKSLYFKSLSSNIATTGQVMLAHSDTIDWRNAANTADLSLSVDASNNLVWNGTVVPTSLTSLTDGKIWIGNALNVPTPTTLTGDVTVSDLGVTAIGSGKVLNTMIVAAAGIPYSKLTLTGSIVNNDIGSSAAIAYSKLALSNSIVNGDIGSSAAIGLSKLAALNASIVPVTDGSGVITSSTVTATELSYVSGVTSAIQTQLNSKQATLTLGNLTDSGTDGITVTGGTGSVIGSGTSIAQAAATSIQNGYLTSTDWGTFNAKAPINSPTFTGNPAAPTVANILDATTKIATDAFVQLAVQASMATLPLNLGGISGPVSFASQGAGALFNVTVTGGVITAISIAFSVGGSGYKVGDCLKPTGGNQDAVIYVASVSGTAAATVSILYGGTGYSNGTSGSSIAASSYPFTVICTGALAGDVTLVMTNGNYLTQSNQWLICNNTTGGHVLTVKVSNSSDTAIGTGVTIPAGTNNSSSSFIQTDGVTDVWYSDSNANIIFGNLTDTGTDGITVTGGTGAVVGSGTSIAQHVADSSHAGYLSSTDWSTFNSKQATLSGTTHQVIITGTTLSTPQNIDTTSTPTFGSLTLSNSGLILQDTEGTPKTITITTPATITPASYSLTLPAAHATAGQYLYDSAGNGVLSWNTPAGSGTVNSGTQYQLAYYATSTTAVSGLTLITASRALASDTNGLPVASATTATELGYVNGVTSAIQTQLGTKAPTASPTFTGTITTPSVTFNSTSGIIGTTTNNNAAAGSVGEYVVSVVSGGSPITLVTGVWTNFTSIALSAGDWEVTGLGSVNFGPVYTGNILLGLSLYSGSTYTDLAYGDNTAEFCYPLTASSTISSTSVPAWRVSAATAVTVYIKVFATFSGGTTPVAYGRVSARRMR